MKEVRDVLSSLQKKLRSKAEAFPILSDAFYQLSFKLRLFKYIAIAFILNPARITANLYREKESVLYFCLSVDVESHFSNEYKVLAESYQYDFHRGSLKIANLCEEFGLKATFFIDYPEILAFSRKKSSPQSLLRYLAKKGHDIQLHLHPAIISGNDSPDLSSYKKEEVITMLARGRDLLLSITGESPIIFRAGGYSVGNSKLILESLAETGFLADSSVFPGASNLHGAKFNYIGAPINMAYFPSWDNISNEGNCKILEVPISCAFNPQSSSEAFFLRFDPTNHVMFLKLFFDYLFNNRGKNIIINMIYHSKQVYDCEGHTTESFQNLRDFLRFLDTNYIKKNKQIKIITLKEFVMLLLESQNADSSFRKK